MAYYRRVGDVPPRRHSSTGVPTAGASGTVSGPNPDQWGSLIELTWGGRQPLPMPDGSGRLFLCDGDVVTVSATAPGTDGSRIGLGEVTGRVEPAR